MMKEYRIDRIGLPAVSFRGKKTGFITSRESESKKRWTELATYETDTGKVVLVITGASAIVGEHQLNTVHVLNDIEHIVDILKFTLPAKKLYEQLGLDVVSRV